MTIPTPEEIEAALAVIGGDASPKDFRSVRAFIENIGFTSMTPIVSAGEILAAALFAEQEDSRRYREIVKIVMGLHAKPPLT